MKIFQKNNNSSSLDYHTYRITTDGKDPIIMGILNVTPNSFSDGGDFLDPQQALGRARKMIEEGADIIDIGAESTAPGNEAISDEQEWDRLRDVLPLLLKEKIPVSLDTKKASIAEKFFSLGGTLLNDVLGLKEEENEKIRLLKKYPHTRVICMYNSGGTSTKETIWEELLAFFEDRIALFKKNGIDPTRMILDPGMGGFLSRDPEVSFEVIRNLKKLSVFHLPLLVGTSRKSFLREVSDFTNPKNRLVASITSALLALQNGAHILRVHDVQETKEAVETWKRCL